MADEKNLAILRDAFELVDEVIDELFVIGRGNRFRLFSFHAEMQVPVLRIFRGVEARVNRFGMFRLGVDFLLSISQKTSRVIFEPHAFRGGHRLGLGRATLLATDDDEKWRIGECRQSNQKEKKRIVPHR